jgi:hypothetical protein
MPTKGKVITFGENLMNISSSLDASTITMITSIKGVIDITAAYELLCILYPRNEDGSRFIHPKKTRDKIRYFGIPNIIVCVKYKGKVRGIRENSGQMNNVVSVDLQCCEKNINLKLARTKIQLTGASSEEMGNTAFEILCAHINMVQGHLNNKNSLSEEVKKDTVDWITGNPKMTMEMLENPPSNVNKELVEFLAGYFLEFDTYDKFCEKVHKVMSIDSLCTEEVKPDVSRICNSVYNYTLSKVISLLKMTNHLHMKGFNVSFHNWNSTYLNVSIPIFTDTSSTPSSIPSESSSSTSEELSEELYEDDEIGDDEIGTTDEMVSTIDLDESSKSKKIRVHRFIIYRKGSIRQTSPTRYNEALEVRNTFLEAISDFNFTG